MFSVATQALLIQGFAAGVIGVHAWEISIDQYGYYSRVREGCLVLSAYI